MRSALERRGLELIVLDQTRPDIGLPVVKAVVPGLRHFWPRLGPGRLYDVPVELGWLTAPLDEDELNPDPPAS
jgi:ribosomal protein S12 methylthiotransferase accessory factor